MIKIGQVLLILLSILLSSSLWGSEKTIKPTLTGLPDYYPKVFQMQGIIHEVKKSENSVVINAQRYRFADGVRVHTLRDEYASINNLKNGVSVAFQVIASGNNKNIISKIWILPKGSAELN